MKDSSFEPKEATMKVLIFDIENAPHLAYTWATFFKSGGSTIEVIQEAYILSIAWKWLGEKEVHVRSLRMYPTFKKDRHDDYLLMKDIHDLFDKADVLVAHNAKGHDVPFSNWRFIVHKMKAPSPYKVVDTLAVRKGLIKYKSPSNALNHVSREQGYGGKVEHEGFPMWKKCMDGDISAFKTMEKYNKHDVVLLEKAYLDLRGWMPNHPKEHTKDSTAPICKVPKCGGKGYYRGFHLTKAKKYRRFQCQTCGTWDVVPIPKT